MESRFLRGEYLKRLKTRIVVDLTLNLHSFDEHQELGSTCLGQVLSQNRHGPLDRYYLAP